MTLGILVLQKPSEASEIYSKILGKIILVFFHLFFSHEHRNKTFLLLAQGSPLRFSFGHPREKSLGS